MTKNELSLIVDRIPELPGCYIFTDAKGISLYVGKSKSIHNRLRSYIERHDKDPKTHKMISMASNVDIMLTPTEMDALLLENNLIKSRLPKFNVLMKDDKQYPLLEIDTTLEFPTVLFKRKIEDKKKTYFGPFISSRKIKENIRYLRQLFKIRSCSNKIIPDKYNQACLYHQIGNCPSPCSMKISSEEYNDNINDLLLFLKGRRNQLLEKLQNKMLFYSDQQLYEKASCIRDNIIYLKAILQKQKVMIDYDKDIDIIGTFSEGEYIVISILYLRNRNITDKKDLYFYIKDKILDEEFICNFLINQYSPSRYIPDLIVIDNREVDKDIIKALLKKHSKKTKIINYPKKQLYSMMKLAKANAKNYFRNKLSYQKAYSNNIKQAIRETLSLNKEINSIDCFDVSNLFGRHSVGVCVRFCGTQPQKRLYRKFNLKHKIDDFDSIRETVLRRYKNLDEQDLPDLIIIDGGPVQLLKAKECLSELNLEIPLISISKINTKEQLYEKVHLPDNKYINITPKDSHLLFLARTRDEAHRFAVQSHRKKRSKDAVRSVLDEIPGIGPKRKKELMAKFQDVKNISDANIDEISKIKGITRDMAITIKSYIRSQFLKVNRREQ